MENDTKALLKTVAILVAVIVVNLTINYIIGAPYKDTGLLLSVSGFVVYKLYQMQGKLDDLNND